MAIKREAVNAAWSQVDVVLQQTAVQQAVLSDLVRAGDPMLGQELERGPVCLSQHAY